MSWLLGGDFNEVLNVGENLGVITLAMPELKLFCLISKTVA